MVFSFVYSFTLVLRLLKQILAMLGYVSVCGGS